MHGECLRVANVCGYAIASSNQMPVLNAMHKQTNERMNTQTGKDYIILRIVQYMHTYQVPPMHGCMTYILFTWAYTGRRQADQSAAWFSILKPMIMNHLCVNIKCPTPGIQEVYTLIQ